MIEGYGLNSIRKKRPFRKWLYSRSAAAFRWVHIYVSMLSFAALMFFAFTGITLNHPTWLGGSEQIETDIQGELPEEIAAHLNEEAIANETVDKLAIAEWLRDSHKLKGKVTEFQLDKFEAMVVFKGPGYAADVFIDSQTKGFFITETKSSLIAILNDLHKGRDSGSGWAWFIDISAGSMMLMSLSGFGLLFYPKKRRLTGTLTALVGTVVIFIVWVLFVP